LLEFCSVQILVLTKMTSTVEISVQKAIDPYLKIENLGRGGEML